MADAMIFPLALDDFFGGLPLVVLGFDLGESTRISQTGGGEILTAEGPAPRLWRGSVSTRTHRHAVQRKLEAKARVLRQAGASFFVGDPTAAYPAADPMGSIHGSATPIIHTLDADNKRMRIGGLPSNYVLTIGDQLSFSYGSSPARYALHEVVTDQVTASSAGLTPLFEVSPFIRPGAITGLAVTLIRPVCKAVMVPGEFRAGERRPYLTTGFSFSFRQTLR